jgi:hypothetical protein
VSDKKQPALPRSLRDRLGPLGFKITLAVVVLAGLVVGAGVSKLVHTFRRPPIVAPRHGALAKAVLASVEGFVCVVRRYGTRSTPPLTRPFHG